MLKVPTHRDIIALPAIDATAFWRAVLKTP